MKKLLTFVPLGIGISAAIIYVFNVVQFRIINNSATLLQILSNLKIYLYISIAGFVFYFLINVLFAINRKKDFNEKEPTKNNSNVKEDYNDLRKESETSAMDNYNNMNQYVPNYDYVPRYKKEEDIVNNEIIKEPKTTRTIVDNSVYCSKCGAKILDSDTYCRVCGALQKEKKSGVNPVLRNIINVLEIVILILILYFVINMMFDYKESKDPNFKSPFKISMTK